MNSIKVEVVLKLEQPIIATKIRLERLLSEVHVGFLFSSNHSHTVDRYGRFI